MCHRTAHSLGGNRWLAAAEADRQTDSAGISTGIWESKRHVDQAALYQTSAVWVVVVPSKYINKQERCWGQSWGTAAQIVPWSVGRCLIKKKIQKAIRKFTFNQKLRRTKTTSSNIQMKLD